MRVLSGCRYVVVPMSANCDVGPHRHYEQAQDRKARRSRGWPRTGKTTAHWTRL